MKKNNLLLIAVPVMIALFFVVVYKYAYVAIRADVAAIKDDEDMRLRLLGKYMGLIAERPAIEKRLGALKEERKNSDLKLIEGQTSSLAAAHLQETVKGIVVAQKGTISSERVGKPEQMGKFSVITVNMEASVPDVAALNNILYAIETSTPYMSIRELDTRVRNPFKSPRELLVRMDVSALVGGKQ